MEHHDQDKYPVGVLALGAVVVLGAGWAGWRAIKGLGKVLTARRAEVAQDVSSPQLASVLSEEGGVDTSWADPGNRWQARN
ncbi:MAG: hypothetical protein AB198_01400 [Parcubacteria bacterium C7867-003]|nr:MAG: hypothetical protein AB198_01400 [Parcubacteria bacterium C7867-003]